MIDLKVIVYISNLAEKKYITHNIMDETLNWSPY